MFWNRWDSFRASEWGEVGSTVMSGGWVGGGRGWRFSSSALLVSFGGAGFGFVPFWYLFRDRVGCVGGGHETIGGAMPGTNHEASVVVTSQHEEHENGRSRSRLEQCRHTAAETEVVVFRSGLQA
ncbi:hypothetical protein GW17_00057670 [Ensete ventricosum]|nr:hypothetical protein GW17_00057670 [Ensete ventricosum]